jgi:hypothetical protein
VKRVLAALAALAFAQGAVAAVCTGMSRIETLPGERVAITQGPDFEVYRVTGPTGGWSVYDGYFADVAGNAPKRFLQRGDVSIMSLGTQGAAGYLAADPHGEQNHFFGPLLADPTAARRFFDRVLFGADARARCIAPKAPR